MTNEEAKQQAIKNAYGQYYDMFKEYIDENGYVAQKSLFFPSLGISHDFEIQVKGFEPKGETKWRPKQLQGIEDNNGWIRIESENDLPKEDCKCWVITSSGEEYMALYLDDFKKFWELMDLDFRLYTTHYMPIITPKNPIF